MVTLHHYIILALFNELLLREQPNVVQSSCSIAVAMTCVRCGLVHEYVNFTQSLGAMLYFCCGPLRGQHAIEITQHDYVTTVRHLKNATNLKKYY